MRTKYQKLFWRKNLMQTTTITLHCPNSNCQYPNLETKNYCDKCGTSLLKRYLQVVGRGIASYRIGDLLCDRFLLKSENIVLDTQPTRPILIQARDSHLARPYVKLFSHRPHIPQTYSLLNLNIVNYQSKLAFIPLCNWLKCLLTICKNDSCVFQVRLWSPQKKFQIKSNQQSGFNKPDRSHLKDLDLANF